MVSSKDVSQLESVQQSFHFLPRAVCADKDVGDWNSFQAQFLGCLRMDERRLATIIEHNSDHLLCTGQKNHLDREEGLAHLDTIDKSMGAGNSGGCSCYVLPITSGLAIISLATNVDVETRAARAGKVIFICAFAKAMARLQTPGADRKIESDAIQCELITFVVPPNVTL